MKNSLLSIIIPVHNEEGQLDRLLRHLQVFDGNPVEILFVDGGSTDRTVSYLKQRKYQVFSSKKGRGNQLAKGAQLAQGQALLFLHADSYFKASPYSAIMSALKGHPAGAFKITFPSRQPMIKMIEWGSRWRLNHRKIAFGDQGMFILRNYYDELGGFHSLPLMEDYDLSLRAKKAGQPFLGHPLKIFASDRRLQSVGSFKMLVRMQYCQYLFRQGAPMDQIAKIYYQD